MKVQEWNEGLNHIDFALVREYVAHKDGLSARRKEKSRRLGRYAAAACFCVVLSIAMFLLLRRDGVPVYDDPVYTAAEVASMFPEFTAPLRVMRKSMFRQPTSCRFFRSRTKIISLSIGSCPPAGRQTKMNSSTTLRGFLPLFGRDAACV